MVVSKTERRHGGSLVIHLSGIIDESAQLNEIFAGVDGDVVLELSGIERMNSMGVHHWIPIITSLSRRRRTVVEALSYAMVMQANCVANLLGSAEVRSCQVPYYCVACDSEQMLLVDAGEVRAANGGAPRKRCGTCAGELSFDEPDSYFSLFQLREG